MPFITNRAYILIFPFLIILLIKERKNALAMLIVAFFCILLADWAGNMLKHLIGRIRPCNELNNVHLLVGCGQSYSMPSNHTINSFAFAIPFLMMSRSRISYMFIFTAGLVGFSRIYVGVHYPLDVMVGALLGSALSTAVVHLYKWAQERYRDKPHTTVLIIFLLAISLFRIYYITNGPMDLSPDEAHYWEWSRRLDLSYYSKGPMIAYLIAFGTSVFGNNVLGVRFLAVITSLLSSIFLYKLAKDIYNEKTGAWSAILFQVIPLYSAFGVIFTIDSPFIFFWILSLYLFWKAINDLLQKNSELQGANTKVIYWLLIGLSVGMGLLTKYTMAFFYICALFFLVFSKQHRRLLKTAYPYISLSLSVLVFSPVIIWNARHDWVTILHTAGQANVSQGLQISLKYFAEFIGSQFGVLTPVLFILAIIAVLKIQNPFISCFSAPVIVFFVLKSLQGKVQANWAMMGYLTGLIALSYVFINSWSKNRLYLKAVVALGILLSIIITGIAHYPAGLIPVKLDPSARLRGWDALGKNVSGIYNESLKDGKTFIFSDSYQVASELAFYVKGQPVTYCANIGRRMNQYDLWPDFNSLIHYNSIFVRIDDTELPFKIKQAFASCEKQVIKISDKGRPLREYSIFACRDFKGMETERITRY